jgi:hypothetical protein
MLIRKRIELTFGDVFAEAEEDFKVALDDLAAYQGKASQTNFQIDASPYRYNIRSPCRQDEICRSHHPAAPGKN